MDLINGVKNDRHEDFELIKARYKPLINDMAKSFEESGAGGFDDLFEEAQRALLKAALSFDSSKEGITFGLYAKICIRNALISVRRASSARRKREVKIAEKGREASRRTVMDLGEMSPEEAVEKLKGSLSEYETRVLREFFSGNSAEQTARILGTDRKSVYNAVFRIKQKAKLLSRQS
ncbi:MAG: sigma-70 family RNA polymerase sigma factor [Clostridia bacterium]|nr:sigma-70 family RNA polymerase sigma factor [Clostridia bacterium]